MNGYPEGILQTANDPRSPLFEEGPVHCCKCGDLFFAEDRNDTDDENEFICDDCITNEEGE